MLILMTPVQVGPIYLAEMAPAKLRGTLNVLFQLMVTIGAPLTMVTLILCLSPSLLSSFPHASKECRYC